MARTAKETQAASEQAKPQEQLINVTIYLDNSFHFGMALTPDVLRGILDPDVPDVFLEVPPPLNVSNVKHRYRHTSRIAMIDLHDELVEEKPASKSSNKGG